MSILGQVALKKNSETGESAAVATLHGVRRIPGGTVIYFSIGYPASTKDTSTFIVGVDKYSLAYSRSPATVPATAEIISVRAGDASTILTWQLSLAPTSQFRVSH